MVSIAICRTEQLPSASNPAAAASAAPHRRARAAQRPPPGGVQSRDTNNLFPPPPRFHSKVGRAQPLDPAQSSGCFRCLGGCAASRARRRFAGWRRTRPSLRSSSAWERTAQARTARRVRARCLLSAASPRPSIHTCACAAWSSARCPTAAPTAPSSMPAQTPKRLRSPGRGRGCARASARPASVAPARTPGEAAATRLTPSHVGAAARPLPRSCPARAPPRIAKMRVAAFMTDRPALRDELHAAATPPRRRGSHRAARAYR
jgi:hypothetical protein